MTKICRFLAVLAKINTVELAALFHREIELRYGPPIGIVSDWGLVFTSEFWADLTYRSYIQRRLSTAFYLQTDRQIERMNQVIEYYLRCFISED